MIYYNFFHDNNLIQIQKNKFSYYFYYFFKKFMYKEEPIPLITYDP